MEMGNQKNQSDSTLHRSAPSDDPTFPVLSSVGRYCMSVSTDAIAIKWQLNSMLARRQVGWMDMSNYRCCKYL
jgi:hypothetical protein